MSVPLKANQVRAYTNKSGDVHYYIVITKGSNVNQEYGALWFRMCDDTAMHLSFGFKVSSEHPLIMENINIIRSTLETIHVAKSSSTTLTAYSTKDTEKFLDLGVDYKKYET